jgi:acyl-CoA reductase-like NAD-dependent aldehyde dehydrogenase
MARILKDRSTANRISVRKTYKLYIGGKFVRSESGRVLTARSAHGHDLDNYSHASRKDFRDAVVAARNAFEAWSASSAYLRGQILYRAAEILENRREELASEIGRSLDVSRAKACREVTTSIDRLVYFAGWTDKVSQIFGAVNPVSSPHFNFTVPEPTGVVALVAPDQPPLLAPVSLLAPAILTGNTAVLVLSDTSPLAGLTFAEIIATSDIPPGVVNVLAGRRSELAPHMAGHFDVNAIVNANEEVSDLLQSGTGVNLKRYVARELSAAEWSSARAQDPYWITDTFEFKTTWHPIGL